MNRDMKKNRVEKLRKEIEISLCNDELWKARENFNALIRVSPFDQTIYKNYADLLIDMREDLQAGKFYFLSGERSEKAQTAIEIFLNRYKKKKFSSIKSQFPGVAQKMLIKDFPEPIKSELLSWDFEDEIENDQKPTLKEKWVAKLIGLALILVLISIPVGLITMFSFVVSLIFK